MISYNTCLSMAYFSMIVSRFIHIGINGSIPSFLWLSNIPLYVYSIVCIFHCIYIPLYIYINHICFILSSADEHLCCFHVLAIVNSISTGLMHMFFAVPLLGNDFQWPQLRPVKSWKSHEQLTLPHCSCLILGPATTTSLLEFLN